MAFTLNQLPQRPSPAAPRPPTVELSDLDGVTWTTMNTQTVSMGNAVYIGLAVTSHNNTNTCNAAFDNVAAAP